MSHAGSQRVTRLVSAGVPITDAFRAVVEEIIDNGPADFEMLNKRIQSAMYLKEKRILSAGWRTWEDFSHDILDQISGVDDDAVPTLSEIQGKWSAIEFTRGAPYTAIPKAGITFTVWDEQARIERDLKARMQMDFTRLKGEAQSVLDRYPDMPEAFLAQVQRAASSFGRMAREVNSSPSDFADAADLTAERVVAPRPAVVRGMDEWRRLTGSDMKWPVKELTIQRVTAMPSGTEFNLKGLTVVVSRLLDEIEKPLPEPLNPVKSSTVRQAVQGKDPEGNGGLIEDGIVVRLNPSTFRRL